MKDILNVRFDNKNRDRSVITRRRFVALTGAGSVIGLAGCMDRGSDGGPNESDSSNDDSQEETTDDSSEGDGTTGGTNTEDSADEGSSQDTGNDGTYTLTVTVENQQGEPIADATVEVDEFDEPDESTGSDGQISFDLSNGEYVVKAEAEGYESNETTVTIDGADESITLSLTEDDNGGGNDDEGN